MGTIIDSYTNKTGRCSDEIKLAIIYFNLIGTTASFVILIACFIRMIYKKKQIKMLTAIILIIFFSEMVHCTSKLMQLCKYFFFDYREYPDCDKFTGRGIICRIQIILAVFSDYCSLLATLLLTFKCHDALKLKNKYFKKAYYREWSVRLVLLVSLAFAIIFYLIDELITYSNVNYRFDVRDRCSYWCWLAHPTSLACFALYFIILVSNIYFFCKTNSFLNERYQELSYGQEAIRLRETTGRDNSECMEYPEEQKEPRSEEELKNYKEINKVSLGINRQDNSGMSGDFPPNSPKRDEFSSKEKERIDELLLIRKKCKIYPIVTIVLWSIFALYRITDDIAMYRFDSSYEYSGNKQEADYFKKHAVFKFFVRASLVIHTFLSDIRGLFYAFCFLAFEEKLFFGFFKKMTCSNSDKKKDTSTLNSQLIKKDNLGDSYSHHSEGNNENVGKNDVADEDTNDQNYERSKKDDDDDEDNNKSAEDNVEMNTSEYRKIED